MRRTAWLLAIPFFLCFTWVHPVLAFFYDDASSLEYNADVTSTGQLTISVHVPDTAGCPPTLLPFFGISVSTVSSTYYGVPTVWSTSTTYSNEFSIPNGKYTSVDLHCLALNPFASGTSFEDKFNWPGTEANLLTGSPIFTVAAAGATPLTTLTIDDYGVGYQADPTSAYYPNGFTGFDGGNEFATWLHFNAAYPIGTATLHISAQGGSYGSTDVNVYAGKRTGLTHSATWNTYDGSNGWQDVGGKGDNDRDQTVAGSFTVNAGGGTYDVDLNLPSGSTVLYLQASNLSGSHRVSWDFSGAYLEYGSSSLTPGLTSDFIFATSTGTYTSSTTMCDHIGTTSTWSIVGIPVSYWFPTGGGVVDCITDIARYLFVPGDQSRQRFASAASALSSRAPFGYASQIASSTLAALDSESSSSTNVNMTIPADAYNGYATQTLALFSTGDIETKVEPLISPIRTVLGVFLWFSFGLALYEFAIHHQKP